MTKSVISFKEEIFTICSHYQGEKCYVGKIQDEAESTVRKKFNIPSQEEIIAYYDFTIFGKWKEGIVISENGLYLKEMWTVEFITWANFAKIKDIKVEKDKIKFNSRYSFIIIESTLTIKDTLEMMIKLRDCAQRWETDNVQTNKQIDTTLSEQSFNDEIIRICANYKGEKCYVGTIPDEIEKVVRKKFNIPSQEQLLAFLDFTAFGSGKEGCAIAESGLYWKEFLSNTIFISWDQLKIMTDIKGEKNEIKFNSQYSFLAFDSTIYLENLVEMITKLRELAVKRWNPVNSHEEPTIEQAIQQICNQYIRNKVYVGSIPESIRDKVYKKFKLANNANILAYFDFTIFGNGKDGAIITSEGIHWKVVNRDFISWQSLNPNLMHANDSSLFPFHGKELHLYGSPLSHNEWIQLLKKIYELPQFISNKKEFEKKNQSKKSSNPFNSLKDSIIKQLQSYAHIQLEPFSKDIINRLCTSFKLPHDIEIWAYMDFTHSRLGKDGVLFTEFGIYWGSKDSLFIPWYRLEELNINLHSEKNQLLLSDGLLLSTQYSPIQKENWIELFNKIQSLSELEEISRKREKDLRRNTIQFGHEQFDEFFIEAIARNNPFLDKFVDYTIDERTAERARLSYRIKDSEQLIAYHRGNTKAKGELGLLLTSLGIYIANPADSKLIYRIHFPFENFIHGDLTTNYKSLYLNNEEIYKDDNVDALLALIDDIRLYVESTKANEFPIEYPYDTSYAVKLNLPVQSTNTERWIIALDGMLQGIYSTREIQWAIDTNQLNPSKIKLWKIGLSRWIDLKETNIF